jgi:glyceraldehyde-3-phosphate dehydrogenase (NADP+)
VHKLSAGERSDKLEALAKLIENRADKLAMLIVQEGGKPIGYAKGEIARCVTTVRTAAAEALRFSGEITPIDFGAGAGKTAFTKRFPIGVIGAITPFNFPLNLVLHKVAPAMAVGCPVVLKTRATSAAQRICFSRHDGGDRLAEGCIQRAALRQPCGGIVGEGRAHCDAQLHRKRQSGLAFESDLRQEKVALELGGNAAVIIDKGTDLAAAAKSVAMGANLYAGQTCISTQRIFVVKQEFEKFRDLLVKEYKALKAGNPADAAVSVGPIIDKGHFERIGSWLQEAVKGGAKLLAGGKAVDAKRNVFAATLLTGTKHSMKVDCAEVFGPIAYCRTREGFRRCNCPRERQQLRPASGRVHQQLPARENGARRTRSGRRHHQQHSRFPHRQHAIRRHQGQWPGP